MEDEREQVKPLNKEEKRLINNEAYANVVVYDAEKEAYVLKKNEDEKLRPAPDEVTEDDLHIFEELRIRHGRNTVFIRLMAVAAAVCFLLFLLGPLFLLTSKAGVARITELTDVTEKDGGASGVARYQYQIGATVYDGSYRYATAFAEYAPQVGDEVKIAVNYLFPSWSYERNTCTPNVWNALLLLASLVLLYETGTFTRENQEIRKYFDKKNMVWY